MKIVFIQLPLLNHSNVYTNGNIQYSSAVIRAFLNKMHRNEHSLESLPDIISSYASNRLIIKYILELAPDIAAFTTYLWNAERNLHIADLLMESGRGIKCFMGGPEINKDSWLLSKKREGIDLFISGEGEWFFKKYLNKEDLSSYTSTINGNKLVIQNEKEIIEATEIAEPFANSYIDTGFDGSVFLEIIRGCPYRCIYCYYSKSLRTVRELPFNILIRALEKNKIFNLKEIYILAPNLNKMEGFKDKLKILSRKNHGVSLHTEMRAHGIDRDTAKAIYDAGFRSLEIGLQTLTPEALKAVGRNSNTEKEIKGILELKKAGIDLKIGIIPGLPGDTPLNFEKTVKRLIDLGLKECIELYPLMLLPGTKILDLAREDKILYQKQPPYFFLQGWGFTLDELKNTIDSTLDAAGINYSSRGMPDFNRKKTGILTNSLLINGDNIKDWDGEKYNKYIDTAVFNFFISINSNNYLSKGLKKLLSGLKLSYELMNIVFETDIILDEPSIHDALDLHDKNSFYRRMHIFDSWADGSVIHLYQVFEDINRYNIALDEYSLIEPVLKVTLSNYKKFIKALPSEGSCLLISRNAYENIKAIIIQEYNNSLDDIAFEDESNQQDFYNSINVKYIKMPFDFRALDLR